MNKNNLLNEITRHLLESEERQEYLFQYSITVVFNPNLNGGDEIQNRLNWIKKNYRDILNICYEESRVFQDDSFSVSKDEFMDTIEPIKLEFFNTEGEKFCILTFKLGGILEGKFLTVEISNDDEINDVSMMS